MIYKEGGMRRREEHWRNSLQLFTTHQRWRPGADTGASRPWTPLTAVFSTCLCCVCRSSSPVWRSGRMKAFLICCAFIWATFQQSNTQLPSPATGKFMPDNAPTEEINQTVYPLIYSRTERYQVPESIGKGSYSFCPGLSRKINDQWHFNQSQQSVFISAGRL